MAVVTKIERLDGGGVIEERGKRIAVFIAGGLEK